MKLKLYNLYILDLSDSVPLDLPSYKSSLVPTFLDKKFINLNSKNIVRNEKNITLDFLKSL